MLELLLVVSVIVIVSLISMPLIGRLMGQYKARGSADAIAAALREARARAVASGWDYRVIGYTAGGTIPNSFRVEGRNPTGGVWPNQTPAPRPSFGATQYADRWTNLQTEFGGSQLMVTGGGSQFVMTYDARGGLPLSGCAPITNCWNSFPITTTGPGGASPRNIQVTTAGGVQVN